VVERESLPLFSRLKKWVSKARLHCNNRCWVAVLRSHAEFYVNVAASRYLGRLGVV
jgi:hypothetical protein